MEQLTLRLMQLLATLRHDPDALDIPGADAPDAPFPHLLIDEDCGQLEAIVQGLDQYPVTFPCLLFSIPEVAWEDIAGTPIQRGTLTLDVKLAFDAYEDTHYGSGQEEAAVERLAKVGAVHSLLHGATFPGVTRGSLRRTASRDYAMPHGIKVYELLYKCVVSG